MGEHYRRLPDSELAVMQVIWDAGRPLARAEIDAALEQEKDWAVSTVLNLLSRLEEKGFVGRTKQGKGYLYHARVQEAAYLESETQSLVGRLYRGRPSAFIAALAGGDSLTGEDVAELEAHLAELKKRRAEQAKPR